MKRLWIGLGVAGLLAGCSVSSPPIVHQPMTARPQPIPTSMPANGSIFQASTSRPLFEDRRPSRVGDTLTVTIEEKTATSNSETGSNERKASSSNTINAGLSLPFLTPYLTGKLAGTSLGSTGDTKLDTKAGNRLSSSFNSRITVTVIDVLPNGNLLVSGEKQTRINSDSEFIRLSGVVNPRDIQAGNVVSSTKLADARVEQQSEGTQRSFMEPGWLTRFFLSVLPF
jgi:flagellar L-ring protein precursor FlgH